MPRIRLTLLAVVLVGAVLGATGRPGAPQAGLPSSDAPVLSTGLPAGPHRVGFHREWSLDHARTWNRSPAPDQARPIRIDVWFPAAPNGPCRRASLEDYLMRHGPRAVFEEANRLIVAWDTQSYRGLAESVHRPVDAILGLRASSCLDARPESGAFPLIVYSGGWYNRSPDNAVLGEYLASSGYVVAAVPLFGEGLITGNLRSTPEALETQARDVAAAVDALTAHAWVDGSRIATMGFSSGGIVALSLAGRDDRIDAVIGLDPSYSGEPEKVLHSAGFSPDRYTTPLLTLRAGNPLFAGSGRDALVESLVHAERYTADVGLGSHGDFSDDVVIESTLALDRPGEPRTTAEGIAAYRAAVSAVQLFADGVLRGDTAALERLATRTPMLRVTRRPASKPPARISPASRRRPG